LLLNDYVSYLIESDSLYMAIDILQQQESNSAKQMLISTYLAIYNLELAENGLNQFVPENQEEVDWKQLHILLLNLKNEERTFFEMSQSEESFIRQLAEDNSCSLASINAQAILRLLYGEEFPLCPVEILNLKSLTLIDDTEKEEAKTDSYYLENNIPNPFNETTIIPYRLPDNYSNASIAVFDIRGNKLLEIELKEQQGSINISSDKFKAGVYIYTLIVDGSALKSKRMVLLK